MCSTGMGSEMEENRIIEEQKICLTMHREGRSKSDIARQLGLTHQQVSRRISGALKRERLDPELARKLESQGIVDLAGLHSGWLLQKDKTGSGQSLYFYLGPDKEKISFVDAIMEALEIIPRASLVPQPSMTGEDRANWIFIADLHCGGDYGDDHLEEDFNYCIDDLVSRLPKAEKAVVIELGDLLDANDQKGVTPASGNPCDVRRDDHLKNTKTALRLMKRAIDRAAETHHEVEVHLIKGNHDPTAYIAVLLALDAHYQNVPHINVVVTEEEYRVIPWGECAIFPHHGHMAKWQELKDVWADQFPDEWAKAKMHRLIATAHFHHDRKRDLVGAVAEQFRTLHRPNAWAKSLGFYSRGSLSAITVHKEKGEIHRTSSNIRPVYIPDNKRKRT